MAKVTLKVKGMPRISKELRRLQKRLPSAFAAALYLEAFRIMAKSVRQIPVDTGRIRDTAFVSRPRRTFGGGTVITIGYGTEYGLFLHEDMEAKHVVGNAKFLENPIRIARVGFARRIKRDVERFSKSGVTPGARAEFPTSPQDKGRAWQRNKKRSGSSGSQGRGN